VTAIVRLRATAVALALAAMLLACAATGPRRSRYEHCTGDSSDGVACSCPSAIDLRELAHNPKIGRLEVRGMNDETDLALIAAIPNVRKVVLTDATQAHLRGVAALDQVEEIVILMAEGEKIFSLAPVASMTKLRVLTLGCVGEADVSALKALPSLDGIIVDGQCAIRGADGTHLEARITIVGSRRPSIVELDDGATGDGGGQDGEMHAVVNGLDSICSIDPKACPRMDPCRREKPQLYTLE
jgi:hypothetical protein